MPEIPINQLTTKQSLRYLIEWSTRMSDAFDRLESEVQQDIQDDSARDQWIAQRANQNLAQVASDAVTRADLSDADAAKAKADLDAATSRAAEAADALAGSAYTPDAGA